MKISKKTIPLTPVFIGVVLGALITYLTMSLIQTQRDMQALQERGSVSPVAEVNVDLGEKQWIDELIEKQQAETERQSREQQAQGDALKSQFEQFAD